MLEANAFEHGAEDLFGTFLCKKPQSDNEEEHSFGGEFSLSNLARASLVEYLLDDLLWYDAVE